MCTDLGSYTEVVTMQNGEEHRCDFKTFSLFLCLISTSPKPHFHPLQVSCTSLNAHNQAESYRSLSFQHVIWGNTFSPRRVFVSILSAPVSDGAV